MKYFLNAMQNRKAKLCFVTRICPKKSTSSCSLTHDLTIASTFLDVFIRMCVLF